MKKCSIILVAYFGDAWLPKCLETLKDASTSKLHLVLVDNSGNEGLKNLNRNSFHNEDHNTPRPLGFAKANNYSLANLQEWHEYTVFLNQDTVSQPEWIDRCLSSLDSNPELAAISPLIRNYNDTGWDPSFLDCLSPKQEKLLEYRGQLPPVLFTKHVPAPALIVRSSVLQKIGPFDPIYGSYYEDYDLCARICKAGYEIGFCTKARIQHYSGSSTNTPERERKRMQQILRNRAIYRIRHERTSRVGTMFRLFALDFPRRLVRAVLRTPSSQPVQVVLTAHYQVLKQAPRILFKERDTRQFSRYLHSIGWKV